MKLFGINLLVCGVMVALSSSAYAHNTNYSSYTDCFQGIDTRIQQATAQHRKDYVDWFAAFISSNSIQSDCNSTDDCTAVIRMGCLALQNAASTKTFWPLAKAKLERALFSFEAHGPIAEQKVEFTCTFKKNQPVDEWTCSG